MRLLSQAELDEVIRITPQTDIVRVKDYIRWVNLVTYEQFYQVYFKSSSPYKTLFELKYPDE